MTGHKQFLTKCVNCGAMTSRVHARRANGKCKACATGIARDQTSNSWERRNAGIIDHGYEAYAREEGQYPRQTDWRSGLS